MNEMQVVGIQKSSFKGDNGETVTGFNVYMLFDQRGVDGQAAHRFFVMPCNFVNGVIPNPGDIVVVYFNRFGKVQSCEVQ